MSESIDSMMSSSVVVKGFESDKPPLWFKFAICGTMIYGFGLTVYEIVKALGDRKSR